MARFGFPISINAGLILLLVGCSSSLEGARNDDEGAGGGGAALGSDDDGSSPDDNSGVPSGTGDPNSTPDPGTVPLGTGDGTGGTGGGAPINTCTDEYPFDDGFTCADQAAWGKCGEEWLADACNLTCGRCVPESGAGGVSECGLEPANKAAGSKARKLLCYLKTNRFISGQTDIPDAEYVEEMTGRYPAIVAFDFYNYTDGDTSETQKAIDWARTRKGIVAFQWHWKSPGGGEYYADYSFENALDDPNSKLYEDIDLVARELKKIGDAGVPVMFRPLHEANNNFMWWQKRGADNYKRLWRLMFERTNAIGANELLWVFNGMARDQSTPLSDWYPGDDVVDVISSDYFQSWEDLTMMQNMGNAKNKVVGIGETFHQLNPATDPPYSFSVVWASRDWSDNSDDAWRTAMDNPMTISIDQLPDMTAW